MSEQSTDGTAQKDHSTCLKCEERTDEPTGTCPTCGSNQMVRGSGGIGESDTGTDRGQGGDEL